MRCNVAFKVDMTDKKIGDLRDPNAVANGYHIAVIEDTYEDPEKGDQVFKLKIARGKNEGAQIYNRLFNPENAKDDQASKTCLNHIMVIAQRLGVLTAADEGTEKELDFLPTIGQEIVIKVHNEEWHGQTRAKVAMYGMYELSSDSIPAEERKALGLPELESQKKAAEEKAAKKARGRGSKPDTVTTPPTGQANGSASHAAPVIDTSDL